ncbi:MAG: sulfatase-like hydrolase/transferase [Gemmatimonadetes bacterium]|nr:sulfatase-like hydrolase/transferase [Gemmatimonadota bacterium]MYC13608.1 sulfatase-like hydrolase/transferase [Gemmatimonadota bacterium]MYD63662.1 sulfatase-like hydrolase/transferase [Gemmatimonadota bacterium]MYF74610.1 sulfatase-like hydrolase/transferase [Gemmatimonadota bacterium]MYK52918.1 sulfatase-like hydrolase/transferase [Gemmatimonadota bacterium]
MANQKPLNFIFFQPDEMRAESLACYGHPLIKTPNYDRLAAEGVRFDQCHVQNAQCTPSRVSMMTGLYPHCAGHRSMWHLIRPHEPHLFKYLHEAGYDIHWFGKNDMLAPGSLSCIKEYYEHKDDKRKNRWKSGDKEFYSFDYLPLDCEREEVADYVKVKSGIDFLRNRNDDDNPFFLFLPLLQPHPSYTTHPDFYDMYDPKDIPDLRPPDLDKKPDFYTLIRKYRRLDELSDAFFRKLNAAYLGMISFTDWLLGELMAVMEEKGLFENTVLIVSSDHGDWAGDYGLVEKWPSDYSDTLTHVPLLVKAPGNKAGHVVEGPVEMFDLMPSVLELAGLSTTHTHFARSFVPQLHGEAEDKNRLVFAEGGYETQEPHVFEGRWNLWNKNPEQDSIYLPKGKLQQEIPESVCRTTMIRSLNHKLIRRTAGQDELYDLENDPRELENLIDDSGMQETKSDLERAMLDWFMKTSDTVPVGGDPRGFPLEK